MHDVEVGGVVPPDGRMRQRGGWSVTGALILAMAGLVGATAGGSSSASTNVAAAGGPVADASAEPAATAVRWPVPADVEEEAAAVLGDLDDDELFADGYHPTLDAERVTCALSDGVELSKDSSAPDVRQVGGIVSGVALTDEVTEGDLAGACGSLAGGDLATCVSGAGLPPVVTVLPDDRGCAELGEGARPVGAPDLATVNGARAAEVRLLAVEAAGACVTIDEAQSWAQQQVQAMALPLAVEAYDEGPGCYRPLADWNRGLVIVQPLGMQQ